MTPDTLRTSDYAIRDTRQLKAELRWCIEHASGPRTESTLRWALEVLEEIAAAEREEVRT